MEIISKLGLPTFSRRLIAGVALVGAFCGLPQLASAQTATIYGSLGNFDVSNNTGHDACGFELQIEGLQIADLGGSFGANRYGPASYEAYPGGVYVRWQSPINAADNSCLTKTVAHPVGQGFLGTCYQWNGAAYDNSGCEHFGTYFYSATAGRILARWLAPNPAAPGTLIGVNPPVPVAMPNYYVLAPVRAGDPPQVEVEVDAPEPAESPELYGDAQWMRIYVVQVPREVTLNELLTDNSIVPQDLTQLESDWQIVQDEPASGTNGNRRQHRNAGNLDPTTRTVVRRIELHEFTGQYDPVTHEALCADLLCNAPAADERGDMISAQMTAVLVQSDSLTVTKSGNGNVDSADKRIACGNKCVGAYDAGTFVTLTAKANSGSTFAGWAGACTGTASTCTVGVAGHVDVRANFALIPAAGGGGGGGGGGGAGGGTTTGGPVLSVKVSGGKGSVTGAPGSINCGKVCSTSVAAGTAVTLTATPDVGFRFVNWTGACTGAAAVCTVTVNASTSAQANFSK